MDKSIWRRKHYSIRGIPSGWARKREEQLAEELPGSPCVRKKQLLAADLVFGDCFLALGRDQPVDERLAHHLLHVRMLHGIHQHYAVLVEQVPIALDCDHQVAAVLER